MDSPLFHPPNGEDTNSNPNNNHNHHNDAPRADADATAAAPSSFLSVDTAAEEEDPLLLLHRSRAHTHHVGEETSRLAAAARYLGLATARRPAAARDYYDDGSSSSSLASRIRAQGMLLFADTTYSAARMHSVGVTVDEERIAPDGTLHLLTTVARRRKQQQKEQAQTYEDLADLFQRPTAAVAAAAAAAPPLQVMEVRPTEQQDVEEVVLDSVEGGSLTAAVFGIVKGTVGPAILYLPRGFRLAGWAVAVPATIMATASFLYSANRLLECWKEVSKRDHLRAARMEEIRKFLETDNVVKETTGGKQYGSIQDSNTHANNNDDDDDSNDNSSTSSSNDEKDAVVFQPRLLTYPELARRAFGSGSFLVTLGIAVMQFGVCLTYLIFVPQNLSESVRALTGGGGGTHHGISETYFLIGMTLLEVPLAWIRDIRRLTATNVLATLLIAYGLASCLAIAFQTSRKEENNVVAAAAEDSDEEPLGLIGKVIRLDPLNDTWYLFIGTSFFVFEGSITLLVPLQEAVYKAEDREKFPSVNQWTTTYIVMFYVFFATTCWAAFGDNIRTALTASLPPSSFATSVQLAYSVAVILTFPLQAFPALEVTCHTTDQKAGGHKGLTAVIRNRDALASVIVVLLGLVAYIAIDYLGNVVSLLGSLVGMPIALIFPPLMHNRLVRNTSTSRRMMNYAVAGLGVFAMGAASLTTILSWDQGAE